MTSDSKATETPTEARSASLPGLAVPLAVGAVTVQAWMDIGTEAVRFIWNRLQQDLRTQQAMIACTSLDEMRAVQAQALTAARQHYAAEAARMLDLMGRATAAGLTATAQARRYDDVPL
jgi:hypothetical protein